MLYAKYYAASRRHIVARPSCNGFVTFIGQIIALNIKLSLIITMIVQYHIQGGIAAFQEGIIAYYPARHMLQGQIALPFILLIAHTENIAVRLIVFAIQIMPGIITFLHLRIGIAQPY